MMIARRLYQLQLVGYLDSFASRRQKRLQTTLTKAVLTFFNALTSRIGGSPKFSREYSRFFAANAETSEVLPVPGGPYKR
jgi:hypothetical protein